MSNFRGYYVKIGNCTFTDPGIKRDGLLIYPHLVQTQDAGVLASGKLEIKVLPHTRTKIQMSFPPMTLNQYKTYYSVIMSTMYLEVEYWNEGIDAYESGTFYHNDMAYKPMPVAGTDYVEMEEIHLIEH
jgi:hypothetical protein